MNVAEQAQGEIDGTMPFQRPEGLCQQAFLKNFELFFGSWRFQQALAEKSGLCFPQVLQGHVEIVEFVRRQFEEWESAARFEVNAHHGILLGGIDYKEAGMRSAKQRSGETIVLLQVFPVVNPGFIIFQVDDQFH